ncbi:hypothetical protein Tco_0669454 [Tanacetum coccineum]
MTSFDCRLKAIKACSACGNLHTSAFCCSKEKLKNKILVPMPESSQQHIKIERICFDCGDLLHGLNCLECDLTRKILEKAFQKFQNTSKSSNDNSNVVNAPREPFVVKQDPSVNSSQKSPLIDQKCCCECGDSLDGIFCQQCTPSSGSPTTHSELSLPDYKAFYIDNDHFKEKSSGSTTTHVDFSQYDSFIFDLSNDQFPPADRSDFYHEEFADELAQIISQPEYDRFCFKIEPELGNLTMDVVGNIFQESEPRVHVLNVLPTLELDFIPSSESIFAYVVWIFLPFLFIPVIPPYLLLWLKTPYLIPAFQSSFFVGRMYSHRSGTFHEIQYYVDCPDCEGSRALSFVIHQESGYQQKDRKPSQNDKLEHGMEKTVPKSGKTPLPPFPSLLYSSPLPFPTSHLYLRPCQVGNLLTRDPPMAEIVYKVAQSDPRARRVCKAPEVSDNSAANTLDNENTSLLSSVVVEEDEAPQIISSSAEQIVTEPNSPVLNENSDELVQEDVAEFDGNVL